MLIVIQFPLVDLRKWISEAPHLNNIDWSIPSDGAFVRYFGGIGPRPTPLSKNIQNILGEDESRICTCKKGLRFKDALLPHFLNKNYLIRCAFRRLFSDGVAMVKVEVGFDIKPLKDDLDPMLIQEIIQSYIPKLLRSNITIPGSEQKKSKKRERNGVPLIELGHTLAEAYQLATAKMLENNWVIACRPLVFAEVGIDDIECFASALKARYTVVDGTQIYFGHFKINGMWSTLVLQANNRDLLNKDGSSFLDFRRNFRISFLRCYADFQVLQEVLRWYTRPGSTLDEESIHSFNQYLVRISKRIVNKVKSSAIAASKCRRVTQELAKLGKQTAQFDELAKKDELTTDVSPDDVKDCISYISNAIIEHDIPGVCNFFENLPTNKKNKLSQLTSIFKFTDADNCTTPIVSKLEDRLIIIKSSDNADGTGSGILVSNNGLVLSCYHNFYFPHNGADRTMSQIKFRKNNHWETLTYNQDNICSAIPKGHLEDCERLDLYLIRIKDWDIKLANLRIQTSVEPNDSVNIVVWDDTMDVKYRIHPGKVLSVEAWTAEHPDCLKLDIPGYPGCSGGGVFNENGDLIGIINYIKEKRNNEIIASLITDRFLLESIRKEGDENGRI